MAQPLLEISNFTRRFGGLVAVDSVSMTIADGEVRGLIGPNGAGKTTLLNLISGQLPPTTGRICFNGADVSRAGAHSLAALGIRRTFQNLKLFDELTVLDNVLIGSHTDMRSGVWDSILRTSRHRREEGRARDEALQALSLVGLSDWSDTIAASLPYGHRRLLEIARAIVARPRLLLLDEPAAGLNPTEAVSLIDLLHRLNQRGITILIVDHHMEVVMTACHCVTVVHHGRKLGEGTPHDICSDEKVIEAYLGRNSLEDERGSHAGD